MDDKQVQRICAAILAAKLAEVRANRAGQGSGTANGASFSSAYVEVLQNLKRDEPTT